VPLSAGVVTVDGKHGKTREILLHPSTIEVLTGYAQLVKRSFPHRDGTSFFVSAIGTPLNQRRVNYVFTRLAQQAGLHPRSQRCRVTPMSLRHSFAVNTLTGWYQAGVDVDAHLPLLSTARARLPSRYLLVPVGGPGAAGAGRRADDPSLQHP